MNDAELKEMAELQDELIWDKGPHAGKPKKDADPDKLARLKELLDASRDEAPALVIEEPVRKKKKIKLAAAPKKTHDAAEDEVALEREIRRYVKKSGGFRRDISPEARAEGVRLLKLAGRKDVKWNERIRVPGYVK